MPAEEEERIIGFDAGPKQVKDLEDGLISALVAQNQDAVYKSSC